MGLFSKDIETLDDLFTHGLQDIYYAEKQVLRALSNLIDKASNSELRKGLKKHLKETETQLARLEQIFEMREQKPRGTRCYGIEGLIGEGDELTGNIAGKKLLDVGIIASAEAVEHYEITRYSSLIAWARQLDRNDFADILGANLQEEEATKNALAQLAGKISGNSSGSAEQRPRRKASRTGRAKRKKPKAA
jgi:ferritin-like metal-binding protein YciE